MLPSRRPSLLNLLASSALALALVAPAARAQTPAVPTQKAVFQVSDADPQKWNLALNNARNVQDDLGGPEAVDLEIVVYGPGIGMLKSDSPVAQRVAAALKSGVKVVACENTMKSLKLTYADMLPAIGYVSAGVVELMNKQREGYAYIRP
jgi:intracellular sulfur oxidation DsrE/DsrF family protein